MLAANIAYILIIVSQHLLHFPLSVTKVPLPGFQLPARSELTLKFPSNVFSFRLVGITFDSDMNCYNHISSIGRHFSHLNFHTSFLSQIRTNIVQIFGKINFQFTLHIPVRSEKWTVFDRQYISDLHSSLPFVELQTTLLQILPRHVFSRIFFHNTHCGSSSNSDMKSVPCAPLYNPTLALHSQFHSQTYQTLECLLSQEKKNHGYESGICFCIG